MFTWFVQGYKYVSGKNWAGLVSPDFYADLANAQWMKYKKKWRLSESQTCIQYKSKLFEEPS